jgi:MFS transporter, PHS family, inorganic phosphate transporter
MMGAVFSMQGIGQFTAAIVALICAAGYKGSLSTGSNGSTCVGGCATATDQMWRIIIGFGAVPACIALYYRLTIPETPRYTFDVARDVEKAADDAAAYMDGKAEGTTDEITRIAAKIQAAAALETPKPSWSDFCRHYGQWKNGKILLGTAGSWFFLDIAYYGLSLNNSFILSAIGYTGGANMYEVFFKTAVGNLILVCAGAIPGYWASVATIDIFGRKPVQLLGFSMLTILFIIIGFAFLSLPTNGLLALYVLAQFFFNFGPNTTTFIVPGECFPTRYRSTSHGISAASGKVGAIIAQVVFGPLKTINSNTNLTGPASLPWIGHIMEIFALFMLLGLCTTLLIPETARSKSYTSRNSLPYTNILKKLSRNWQERSQAPPIMMYVPLYILAFW